MVPSDRKTGAFDSNLDAVLLLRWAFWTGSARNAQHRAGDCLRRHGVPWRHCRRGGQTRTAAIAPQQTPCVPATTACRRRAAGQIVKPEHVIHFPVGQSARVGDGAAAMKLQPQATVEMGPQAAIIRCTCRRDQRAAIDVTSTLQSHTGIPPIRPIRIRVIRKIRAYTWRDDCQRVWQSLAFWQTLANLI